MAAVNTAVNKLLQRMGAVEMDGAGERLTMVETRYKEQGSDRAQVDCCDDTCSAGAQFEALLHLPLLPG